MLIDFKNFKWILCILWAIYPLQGEVIFDKGQHLSNWHFNRELLTFDTSAIFTSIPAFSFSSSWANEQNKAEDLHYAIVVDAGSSGSRAYLYSWPSHSGDPNELLKISPLTSSSSGEPLVKSTSPGLSRYNSLEKNYFCRMFVLF